DKMEDHIAIPGEYCTLIVQEKAVAATRTFSLSIDRASYGNFVARGTSKWRTNYVADIGATMDGDGLIICKDPSPPEAWKFDDLFTYMQLGTKLATVFTLRGVSAGELTFIYTGEAYLTALSTAAPEFGEATYSFSLIFTGAIVQTTGTVPSPPY
ncbi:unnamed protein product, partial [marine sediment metagenome]